MLWWIVVFLVIAIVAAVFGFGGIAATAAWFAIVIFWIFLGLLALAIIIALFRRA